MSARKWDCHPCVERLFARSTAGRSARPQRIKEPPHDPILLASDGRSVGRFPGNHCGLCQRHQVEIGACHREYQYDCQLRAVLFDAGTAVPVPVSMPSDAMSGPSGKALFRLPTRRSADARGTLFPPDARRSSRR